MENGLDNDEQYSSSETVLIIHQETRIINIPDDIPHLYLRPPYGKREKSEYHDKGLPLMKLQNLETGKRQRVNLKKIQMLYFLTLLKDVKNQTDFARKLVQRYKDNYIDLQVLKITNMAGNTALCLAAVTGNVEIAEVLIKEYSELWKLYCMLLDTVQVDDLDYVGY